MGVLAGVGQIRAQEEQKITAYLFHSVTCPHCKAEIKWFKEKYLPSNSDVELKMYEVSRQKKNSNALTKVAEALDFQVSGVPLLVIGEEQIVGFGEGTTDKEIERIIVKYRQGEYQDRVGEIVGGVPVVEEIVMGSGEENAGQIEEDDEERIFNLPILGEVNPKTASLPILAIVIGLVDGFNPCAMWILIFLITMLFNMKDKKKMWILGITFLVTSAVVYLLFMMTWLNLAVFLNKVRPIQMIIAGFAIVFGAINLNNYYKSLKKADACEVVKPEKRKKIIEQIKKVTSEQKFWLALVGIIVLAISVNLIELLCSLGLPVVFTQILSLNNLSAGQYGLYMFLYILFFLIDDIIVFVIAMKTLKIATASSKYAKYSHLIGGLIMVIIGILMLLKPEILMFNF
jgi:glutaredoxin